MVADLTVEQYNIVGDIGPSVMESAAFECNIQKYFGLPDHSRKLSLESVRFSSAKGPRLTRFRLRIFDMRIFRW